MYIEKRKGDIKMRTLTYDIFTKNGILVDNTTSYALATRAKEEGYTVKEKLVFVKEEKPKKVKKKFRKNA